MRWYTPGVSHLPYTKAKRRFCLYSTALITELSLRPQCRCKVCKLCFYYIYSPHLIINSGSVRRHVSVVNLISSYPWYFTLSLLEWVANATATNIPTRGVNISVTRSTEHFNQDAQQIHENLVKENTLTRTSFYERS